MAAGSPVPVQPYVVAFRKHNGKLGPFFLVVDRVIIEVGNNAVIAVDILFKCHYVFNLHYDTKNEPMYTFLEHYVYKVPSRKGNPPTVPPASLKAFYAKVQRVVL